MSNPHEKLQGRQKRTSLLYTNSFSIISSAGIALSVIFTQAFIGTGITDNLILYSVICFSVAIPLLLLHIFIASLEKGLRGNIAPGVLFIFFSFGGFFCLLGIVLTFLHLSSLAGILFAITSFICLTLASILIIIVPAEEQNDVNG